MLIASDMYIPCLFSPIYTNSHSLCLAICEHSHTLGRLRHRLSIAGFGCLGLGEGWKAGKILDQFRF